MSAQIIMSPPSVIRARPAGDAIGRGHGIRLAAGATRGVRRDYRRLRLLGLDPWLARDVLSSTLFTGMTGGTFVPLEVLS